MIEISHLFYFLQQSLMIANFPCTKCCHLLSITNCGASWWLAVCLSYWAQDYSWYDCSWLKILLRNNQTNTRWLIVWTKSYCHQFLQTIDDMWMVFCTIPMWYICILHNIMMYEQWESLFWWVLLFILDVIQKVLMYVFMYNLLLNNITVTVPF